MTNALTGINSQKTNTCPHGLPVGACPICNGMGGGGMRADKKHTPRRTGEMTYAQCAAIGARMRAARESREQTTELLRQQQHFMQIKQNIGKLAQRLQNTLSQIQKSLPTPVNSAFSAISNNIITPVLNMIKNIPNIIQNISEFVEKLKGEFISTLEKLTAVIGDIKNFINAKVKEKFNKIKRKILSLFGFSIIETGEDEEIYKQIEIQESRKVKNLILRLFGEEKEDEHKQLENGKS